MKKEMKISDAVTVKLTYSNNGKANGFCILEDGQYNAINIDFAQGLLLVEFIKAAVKSDLNNDHWKVQKVSEGAYRLYQQIDHLEYNYNKKHGE